MLLRILKEGISNRKNGLNWPNCKLLKRNYNNDSITVAKSIPGGNRIGIFALRRIRNEETIFVEDPLLSVQSTLNKKFVNGCQNCMKHISVQKENILDFLPQSASPYLPKRLNTQYSFQILDERKNYCSSECFDRSFTKHIELLSPFADSSKKPYRKFKELEEIWNEYLPTVSLEMIFKAICLDILNLNPTLTEITDPTHVKERKKLKCLSNFTYSNVAIDSMSALIPSVVITAQILFKPFCPFKISENLIRDAISRLIYNCVHFNLTSPSPIEVYLASTVVRSKEDVQKINEVEEKLILNGNGNIKTIWHPTGFALFENISILKRSDDPNSIIIFNETHQAELIACKTIERNEEITINKLQSAQSY